jgi:hypothetical protein
MAVAVPASQVTPVVSLFLKIREIGIERIKGKPLKFKT